MKKKKPVLIFKNFGPGAEGNTNKIRPNLLPTLVSEVGL